MKKLLFVLLVLAAAQGRAQAVKGSIEWKDSTVSRVMPFDVAAGGKQLKYDVNVYAAIGLVTVTLADPEGKEMFHVTLGTEARGGGHEPSKGELNDVVTLKTPGTWQFTIRGDHATGTISYTFETIKP